MSTPWFRDPFRDPQGREQAALGERIGNIEARPHVVPAIPLTPAPINGVASGDWYRGITSAAFLQAWEMAILRYTNLAIWCTFNWRTGAGTTGEVRLRTNVGGTTSSAVALGAASSGVVTFRWLHSQAIWTADSLWVEARRTVGANLVEIQAPSVAMIDPAQATTAGV